MPSINVDMNWVYIAIAFVCAIILQQFVFMITGCVHKVTASEGNECTCLHFYHEQSRFATINLCANVLVPNVAAASLQILLLQYEYETLLNSAFLIIPFYFVYRWFAILISLRERELFKARYEVLYFFCGIGLGVATAQFIRLYNKTWEFTLAFWSDKLWAIGVLSAFLLIVLLCGILSRKSAVITEGMLAEYIARRFEKMYGKYKDFTIVDAQKAPCWVFLYSIAIYEGLGRKRKRRINRKNINLVFDRIDSTIFNSEEDDPTNETIYEYALKYHNEKKYAQSVAFIHYFVKRFIEVEPFYYSIFCIGYKAAKDKAKEQEETVMREVAECLAEQLAVEVPEEPIKETPKEEQHSAQESPLLDFDIFEELEVELQPEERGRRGSVQPERVTQDVFMEQIAEYIRMNDNNGTKKNQDININLNVNKDGKTGTKEYITLLRAARRANMMSEEFLKKMRRENVPIMFRVKDVEFYFKHKK